MTDRELAIALQQVQHLEAQTRAHFEACRARDDLAEADAAVIAYRHAVPLRRALETWTVTRAARAALEAGATP